MPTRKHWLDVSARMYQYLLPSAVQVRGDDATAVDAARVDDALIAMALAQGPENVPALVAACEPATLATLRLRWSGHAARWQAIDAPQFPWVPPQKPDVWRAVLLALVADTARADETRRALWPEQFGAGCRGTRS